MLCVQNTPPHNSQYIGYSPIKVYISIHRNMAYFDIPQIQVNEHTQVDKHKQVGEYTLEMEEVKETYWAEPLNCRGEAPKPSAGSRKRGAPWYSSILYI